MRIVRILRGIVKTALTWAVMWAPVSLIPLGVATLFGTPVPPRVVGLVLITQAVTGAINGGVFASVLAVFGRRKTFETMSLRWIAACGAVGGALFPIAVRAVLFATLDTGLSATSLAWTLVTNAVLGAGFATVTLSIARRAPALPARDEAALPAIPA